ncbi:2-alkenal reductase (NADP(+)) [Sarracenia purpurea var. burkii]
MAEREDIEVSNKQIILRDYVTGSPKVSDMAARSGTIRLKVPDAAEVAAATLKPSLGTGEDDADLVGDVDPRLRAGAPVGGVGGFNNDGEGAGCCLERAPELEQQAVQVITGYGVARVLDSGHPNFKEGDLVWGVTGWEEYSLISQPETLFKIQNTDVPLSYYAGILVLLKRAFAELCGENYQGLQSAVAAGENWQIACAMKLRNEAKVK